MTEAAATGALAGKVVLVAGAHGGLGSAAATACAAEGATVVLLGRRLQKLNRLHDGIVAAGGQAVLYPLDLEGAGADDYAEMTQRIVDELGRLDGVLHSAAEFRGLTPLLHTDPADFARALHVGLTARWWLTQACLPVLSRSPGASVVFAIDDRELTGQIQPAPDFTLEDADFADLTKIMLHLARDHAESRFVSVLEGGYNLRGLMKGTTAHVQTLVDG